VAGLSHPALKEEGGEILQFTFYFEFLNLNEAQISPSERSLPDCAIYEHEDEVVNSYL
jgi:hypothetical protein